MRAGDDRLSAAARKHPITLSGSGSESDSARRTAPSLPYVIRIRKAPGGKHVAARGAHPARGGGRLGGSVQRASHVDRRPTGIGRPLRDAARGGVSQAGFLAARFFLRVATPRAAMSARTPKKAFIFG